MRYVLTIPDMSCEHCKMRISRTLEDLGVENFEISLEKRRIVLEAERIGDVLKALEELGYPVENLEEV